MKKLILGLLLSGVSLAQANIVKETAQQLGMTLSEAQRHLETSWVASGLSNISLYAAQNGLTMQEAKYLHGFSVPTTLNFKAASAEVVPSLWQNAKTSIQAASQAVQNASQVCYTLASQFLNSSYNVATEKTQALASYVATHTPAIVSQQATAACQQVETAKDIVVQKVAENPHVVKAVAYALLAGVTAKVAYDVVKRYAAKRQ